MRRDIFRFWAAFVYLFMWRASCGVCALACAGHTTGRPLPECSKLPLLSDPLPPFMFSHQCPHPHICDAELCPHHFHYTARSTSLPSVLSAFVLCVLKVLIEFLHLNWIFINYILELCLKLIDTFCFTHVMFPEEFPLDKNKSSPSKSKSWPLRHPGHLQ